MKGNKNMNDIIKKFLATPQWKDDVFFILDFNIYAAITGRAWRLPYDFKIRICMN
jgi:hypothetical protein